MSKSTKMDVFNFVYILGMVVVAVGFCLPIFSASSIFGTHSSNGFQIFEKISENKTMLKVSEIGVFATALIGAILGFVPDKNGLKALMSFLKLLCLILSVAGGIYFLLNYGITITKNFLSTGSYLIAIGWLIALAGGWYTSK